MVSKAGAKKADAEAFIARVKTALERACVAAETAAADYAKAAKRDAQGLIAGSCGGGYIVVYKPSYRLRETLKRLGMFKTPPYRGGWALIGFTHKVPEGAGQSYGTNEAACKAAHEVLKAELGTEGDFYPHTYID